MDYVDRMPGREVVVKGRKCLYFSGTGYLGVSGQLGFRDLLVEGMGRYGSNFGGSRLSNLRLAVFEEVEEALADLCGAPAALTFSSGTVAGQVLIKGLKGKGKFRYAPAAHPAVWVEQRVRVELTYEEWVKGLLQEFRQGKGGPMVLFANAVDPLYARDYNFSWVEQIPAEREVWLVIDDSHGLGIRGRNGGGIYAELDLPAHVHLVVVASMAKAFGIPAGVVLGPKGFIQDLMSSPFFGGASPAVPAYLYAFLKSQELYQQYRVQLQQNIGQLVKGLDDESLFQYLPDYPIFYSEKNELADFLGDRQIMISSFPYPSPKDSNITRVVINSLHRPADIDFLQKSIQEFLKQ